MFINITYILINNFNHNKNNNNLNMII